MQRDLPPELEALDAGPGPARALSASAAEAQAQRVLADLRRKPDRSRAVWWVAVACLLALGAWASIAAREPKPVPRTGRSETRPREPAPASVTPPEAPAAEVHTPALAPAAGAVPAPSASRDWLKLANAARERRDYVRAHALYLRALRSDAGSEEAYAASVAAADLEREHMGDAASALRRYEDALRSRPRGALSEQAHAGRARALATLGQPAREAEAWRELLKAHPGSWFAQEARARLRALSRDRE